jgi:hypothetical protein
MFSDLLSVRRAQNQTRPRVPHISSEPPSSIPSFPARRHGSRGHHLRASTSTLPPPPASQCARSPSSAAAASGPSPPPMPSGRTRPSGPPPPSPQSEPPLRTAPSSTSPSTCPTPPSWRIRTSRRASTSRSACPPRTGSSSRRSWPSLLLPVRGHASISSSSLCRGPRRSDSAGSATATSSSSELSWGRGSPSTESHRPTPPRPCSSLPPGRGSGQLSLLYSMQCSLYVLEPYV